MYGFLSTDVKDYIIPVYFFCLSLRSCLPIAIYIGWLVYWVLWHINLCRLFNAKSILCKQSVRLKTVHVSISTQFNGQKRFYFKLFKQLYVTIQLSVNTVLMSKNSSISKNIDWSNIGWPLIKMIGLVWSGLVWWVLWHIYFGRLFNAKSIFM